jgi:hypothetical protein
MRMAAIVKTAILGVAAAPLLALTLAAQDQEAPLDPRVLQYDKGPSKIDVSGYPAEMKPKYKLFVEKCGKCHTPARAINCDFVLEDEWERYVRRMMRKAGTFISADEGKRIFEFVVYDSKIRKKALYEKKLAEAKNTGF